MKTNITQTLLLFAAVNLSLLLFGCGGSDAYSPTLNGQPNPPVVGVTVSPTTASIPALGTQQYTAMVTGTSNKSVTWNIQSNGAQSTTATISSTGLVTTSFNTGTVPNGGEVQTRHSAAIRPGDAGSYTVTATSNADPTKSATATLIVTGSSLVQVTISPTTLSTFFGADPTQFTATVTGNANTGVRWSARLGTITQTGLYTPPTSGGQETDNVTATSLVDPSKSATAVVTITST